MANALIGEADAILPAEDGGEERTLHLVMNNPAWWAVEDLLDKSYLDVVTEIFVDGATDRSPKSKTVSAVLFGATRKHHPTLSQDDCAELLKQHPAEVMPALAKVIRGSIKLKEPELGEAMPAEEPATK